MASGGKKRAPQVRTLFSNHPEWQRPLQTTVNLALLSRVKMPVFSPRASIQFTLHIDTRVVAINRAALNQMAPTSRQYPDGRLAPGTPLRRVRQQRAEANEPDLAVAWSQTSRPRCAADAEK